MTTNDPLTRRERLLLAAAALRCLIAGAVHAVLDWILDHTRAVLDWILDHTAN